MTLSLLVILAVSPPDMSRRSDGGASGASPLNAGTDSSFGEDATPSSIVSSSHFGSSRTLSGIGSIPSASGYEPRRYWRSFVDHGRKEPSMLSNSQTCAGSRDEVRLWVEG